MTRPPRRPGPGCAHHPARALRRWLGAVAVIHLSSCASTPDCLQLDVGFERLPCPEAPRRLQAGESVDVIMRAWIPENPTGVFLERGHRYDLHVVGDREVCDLKYAAGPGGRGSPNPFLWLAAPARVRPLSDWMTLLGRVGRHRMEIGRALPDFRAPESGPLVLMVNDVKGFYGNNHGVFVVRITAYPSTRVD